MSRICIRFKFLIVLLTLTAPMAHSQADLKMLEVVFEKYEPGLEPYQSRHLLSDQYLRLDDGTDQGNFALFDRKTKEIHSFNHEDGTHLVIKPRPVEKLSQTIEFEILQKVMTEAPKIDGVSPVAFQFLAGSKTCKESINVESFLPEFTAVLLAYEQVLVEQSKTTLDRVPENIRSACYMANNYLHASDYLSGGFPLHVSDDEGRRKRLVSYQQVLKPATIVQFPKDYRLYYPN